MPAKSLNERELAMSDADLVQSCLEANRRWWAEFAPSQKRIHGRVPCGSVDCGNELTVETMMPYGGKNYCRYHFRDKLLKDAQHYFSLGHSPTVEVAKQLEWGMRILRAMDGGLVPAR